MGKPAARIEDFVAHPIPPVLTGGPGSLNVLIGNRPAWRGLPAEAVEALMAEKEASDIAVDAAVEAAADVAAVPIVGEAAEAAAELAKTTALGIMSASIMPSAALGVDIHGCETPFPIPPHGPGVVIDGSKTVFINSLPACRQGDTILEALGPTNKITGGDETVLIGG